MINLKILIATIPIEVSIDEKFKNIHKLFLNFKKTNDSSSLPQIDILKSNDRSVELSKDYQKLKISGSDIDNLKDPFNIIGILQAIFRFSAIHSLKKDIYLLHGSASILNNKGLFFGDDGENIGKTLSSIECSLKSNRYIGDEFCFLDLKNKEIFSYSFIPIHIRPEVKAHINKDHKLEPSDSKYIENNAGYFIDPDKLFKVIPSHKLDFFIFPCFRKKEPEIKILNKEQSIRFIKTTLTSHILKLFYPSLDRMKFTKEEDSDKKIILNKGLIDDIVKSLNIEKKIIKIAKTFPCYRTYINKPCDIISLLENI